MAMLLHLCLCMVTVIHVTSSQAACDVTRQENDGVQIVVNNCGCREQVLTNNGSSCCRRNEQVLGELVMSMSRMETTLNGSRGEPNEQQLSQLATAVSRIETTTNVSSSCYRRSEQVLGQLVTSNSQLQQDNNATQHLLSQLATSASQTQTTISQLSTTVSRMETAISQLQRDVAELKSSGVQRNVTGIFVESGWKSNISLTAAQSSAT